MDRLPEELPTTFQAIQAAWKGEDPEDWQPQYKLILSAPRGDLDTKPAKKGKVA